MLSMTTTQYIPTNLIISPDFSDFSKRNPINDGVLSIYLHTTGGSVDIGGGDYGAQKIQSLSMDPSLQEFWKASFNRLAQIINVDFRLSSDPRTADLNIYLDTKIEVGATGTTLGIALENSQPSHNWWEIILNNPALSSNKPYLHYASIHELGHVLGLEHPFDSSDGDVYKTTDPNLSAFPEDTVMAYRSPQDSLWPEWYSFNDIEALISLWGARKHVYSSASDIIQGKNYSETIDGLQGADTFVVSGKSSEYTTNIKTDLVVIKDNVTGRGGTDTLINIERIKFADGTIAADLPVTADSAQIYRLYQAAFARMPDETGLRYWIDQSSKGLSPHDAAYYFRSAPEFLQKYGANLTNAQYVDQLYQNVLGRKGDVSGVSYWNSVLDKNASTKDAVLVGFAGSPENVAGTADHISYGFFIT